MNIIQTIIKKYKPNYLTYNQFCFCLYWLLPNIDNKKDTYQIILSNIKSISYIINLELNNKKIIKLTELLRKVLSYAVVSMNIIENRNTIEKNNNIYKIIYTDLKINNRCKKISLRNLLDLKIGGIKNLKINDNIVYSDCEYIDNLIYGFKHKHETIANSDYSMKCNELLSRIYINSTYCEINENSIIFNIPEPLLTLFKKKFMVRSCVFYNIEAPSIGSEFRLNIDEFTTKKFYDMNGLIMHAIFQCKVDGENITSYDDSIRLSKPCNQLEQLTLKFYDLDNKILDPLIYETIVYDSMVLPIVPDYNYQIIFKRNLFSNTTTQFYFQNGINKKIKVPVTMISPVIPPLDPAYSYYYIDLKELLKSPELAKNIFGFSILDYKTIEDAFNAWYTLQGYPVQPTLEDKYNWVIANHPEEESDDNMVNVKELLVQIDILQRFFNSKNIYYSEFPTIIDIGIVYGEDCEDCNCNKELKDYIKQ